MRRQDKEGWRWKGLQIILATAPSLQLHFPFEQKIRFFRNKDKWKEKSHEVAKDRKLLNLRYTTVDPASNFPENSWTSWRKIKKNDFWKYEFAQFRGVFLFSGNSTNAVLFLDFKADFLTLWKVWRAHCLNQKTSSSISTTTSPFPPPSVRTLSLSKKLKSRSKSHCFSY